MRSVSVKSAIASVVLVCAVLPGVAGCDRDVAGQLATLSGTYFGDVVTVVATECLHDALGTEGSGPADAGTQDEHSHATEAMHNHEH